MNFDRVNFVFLKSDSFWSSFLASTATLLLFVVYLQGSRNPLKAIGIEIPEPRVIFWAATSLFAVIIIRIAGRKFFLNFRHKKKAIFLLSLPIALVSYLLIDKLFSKASVIDVTELTALLILIVSTTLLGPLAEPSHIRTFWLVLIASFSVFLIAALLSGPKGPDQYFDALSVGRIMFARYMAIGAVVTIYFSFKFSKLWLLPLGFAFILGTFLAGSRGVVLSLAVVGVISFIFMKERLKLLFFASISIAGIAFFVFGPWKLDVLRIRYIDLSPSYSAGRDVIWSDKVEILKSNPGQLVTGVSNAESADSHNFFLEMVLNGGVIATAATIFIFGFWFLYLFRNRRILGESALPALLFVLILVGSQFSGTFIENSMIWFFFVLVVLQINLSKNINQDYLKSIS